MTSQQTRLYSMFGLVAESDIELPAPAVLGGPVDIRIRRVAISHRHRHKAGTVAVLESEKPYFGWEAVGGFQLIGDGVIEVDPNPGVPDTLTAQPLLGTVIAAYLQRRDHMVLHASAASLNGRAICLLGDKGAGKSTTVATLISAGHALLSDDVVAVDFSDSRTRILPAFGQLKLWDEAAQGADIRGIERQGPLHPATPKQLYTLSAGFSDAKVELSRLYVLKRGEHAAIVDLPPHEAVSLLLRYAYMARFGELGLKDVLPSFFKRATALANNRSVKVLQVPDRLDRLSSAVAQIEHDLAQH